VDFKQYFVYQTDYQHWANDILFSALGRLNDEARVEECHASENSCRAALA